MNKKNLVKGAAITFGVSIPCVAIGAYFNVTPQVSFCIGFISAFLASQVAFAIYPMFGDA